MKPRVVLHRIVVAAVIFAACSNGGTTPTTTVGSTSLAERNAVVKQLTKNVIVPGYEAFSSSIDALANNIAAMCATPKPTSTAFNAAQIAWRQSTIAWAATRAYRFGPAMELRSMSKIYFPVDRDKIASLLAGTQQLAHDDIAKLGADQRGLGGIESILFAAQSPNSRACRYATSAVALVGEAAATLHSAWRKGHKLNTKEFIDGTVNGMVFALSEVADTKLGKASGVVTEEPKYQEIDSGPAHHALEEMDAILQSVDDLRSGRAASGIGDLVDGQSDEIAQRCETKLNTARTLVRAISRPLFRTTDTAPIATAYEGVRAVLVVIRSEVASILGVTLTLGDADGDS